MKKPIIFLLIAACVTVSLAAATTAAVNPLYDGNNIHIIEVDSTAPVFRTEEYYPNARILTEYGGVISASLHSNRVYFVNMHSFFSGVDDAALTRHGLDNGIFLVHYGLPSNATISFPDYGKRIMYGYGPNGDIVELGRANERLPIADAYFFHGDLPDLPERTSRRPGNGTVRRPGSEEAVNTDEMAKALVMSYNIYYQEVDKRADAIFDLLLEYSPDVMGLQEVSHAWVEKFRNFMSDNSYDYYAYGSHGAEFNDQGMATNNQFAPILWKADKYNLIDSGHFWLSSTETMPVPPQKSWPYGIGEHDYWRCVNWVRLRDKQEGRDMVFLNLHMPADSDNAGARTQSSRLVVEKMKQFSDAGVPILFMGDFNFDTTVSAYSAITGGGYDDARYRAPITTTSGSYNAWDTNKNLSLASYIFVTPNIVPESFAVLDDKIDNNGVEEYPSDHCPLLTSIFY